jgi:hypothetical protein
VLAPTTANRDAGTTGRREISIRDGSRPIGGPGVILRLSRRLMWGLLVRITMKKS